MTLTAIFLPQSLHQIIVHTPSLNVRNLHKQYSLSHVAQWHDCCAESNVIELDLDMDLEHIHASRN